MDILIAVPTFENITPETFKSIYDLDVPEGVFVDFEFVKGYDCARARNAIAKKAVDGGYDYVLMIDSDMIVPADTITKMLEYPADIVVCIAPVKNTKNHTVEIFKWNGRNFAGRYTVDELPDKPRFAVYGSGMSCSLIKTAVFNVIPYPWFQYVVYENGSCLSEDLYFCVQATKFGIGVEADTRVRAGHLARYFQWE